MSSQGLRLGRRPFVVGAGHIRRGRMSSGAGLLRNALSPPAQDDVRKHHCIRNALSSTTAFAHGRRRTKKPALPPPRGETAGANDGDVDILRWLLGCLTPSQIQPPTPQILAGASGNINSHGFGVSGVNCEGNLTR